MRRIGIFGGSFNPVHIGHLALARHFHEECRLDEVWLMVSPQNPLKSTSSLLADEKRLQMVRRAVKEERGLVACDYEFRLPKPSYTWDTLQAMHADFPDAEFVLLIGGDNWNVFTRWYRARDLLANYQIAVYPREDAPIDEATLPQGVSLLHADLVNVSSTEIRRRVRQGETVAGLVPACIERMVLKYYR